MVYGDPSDAVFFLPTTLECNCMASSLSTVLTEIFFNF
jgi:hypothetical protein